MFFLHTQTIIIIFIIIFTKIYIAHIQDSKINRQIESESHKKVISRIFKIKVRC